MKSGRQIFGFAQFVAGFAVLVCLGQFVRWLGSNTDLPHGRQIIRPPNEVSALAVEGGSIWAGGREGLFRIERASAQRIPLPRNPPPMRYVRDLLVDSSGKLWIAHNQGVTILDGGLWTQPVELEQPSLKGPALALFEDSQRRIWIGLKKGLVTIQEQNFRVHEEVGEFEVNGVDVILEDRSGILWFGSSDPFHGGLLRFDGDSWRILTTADGLAHNSVNDILQDRAGNLWFGTGFSRKGGASKLNDSGWSTLGKADGLPGDKIRSLFEDRKGRLWIGSEYDGIAIRIDEGWRVLTPADGLAGWEVKEMVQDEDGIYWLGTESGLSRITDWDN